MIINQTHSTELSSPIQRIFGRVELYNGSTLLKICNCGDVLESFTVDRVGEGKFFGFGVCHQLKTTIFDSNLELNLTKGIKCKVAFVVAENDVCYPFPDFYIEEVSRDEETDDLNITAYDKIYETSKHNFSELSISAPYTVRDAAVSVANFLGLTIHLENINSGDSSFDTLYAEGANLKGTELIRDVLNAIAEVTQTIYFINYDNKLVFKRLNRDGEHLATVDRSNYENLSSKSLYVLKDICSATELGDNVISESTLEGVTQYVRNNPFWELREDLGTLLDAAQNVVGGLSATEFDCSWFGNYLLEIGDKIKFIGRRDKTFYSFLLDDSITFNGDINQTSKWAYSNDKGETAASPTTIGEKLNQTFARVDKVNQEVEIVASKTDANTTEISVLKLDTQSISASVTDVQERVAESNESLSGQIEELSKEVNLKMSSEDVQLAISQTLNNGVDKVTTTTGFTFDADGLTVSKSDSEISTTITEDGMTISKSNDVVLVADNQGVRAEDLHATTYLMIGDNSRFEDRGDRTACFWVGG